MGLVNNKVKKENNSALEYQKRKFINTIEQKVPRKYLELMYYNLKTFYAEFDDDYLIKENEELRKNGKSIGIGSGMYLPAENRIVIFTPKGRERYCELYNIKASIPLINIYYHELFHMSSSGKAKDGYCMGFSQSDFENEKKIGDGINEGYTELLNERFFEFKNNNKMYIIYKIIAEIIESIIGEKKMMNLYFTANLKGLFSELSKKTDDNKAFEFVSALDSLDETKIGFIYDFLEELYENSRNKDDYLIIKKDTDFFNKMKRLDDAINNKFSNKEKGNSVKRGG